MSVTATESSDKKTITLHISGRFDFSCHKGVIEAYKVYPKGEKRFVVDLSKTEYMDSSAMGMLLQLREYSSNDGVNVSLINAQESVLEILKIANFDKLFDIDGIG